MRVQPFIYGYGRWIATYADPGFQDATRLARELADTAAATADPATYARMLAAFEGGTINTAKRTPAAAECSDPARYR